MTKQMVLHITEWLVDGSPRSWTLESELPDGREPGLHDGITVQAEDHRLIQATVTKVIVSNDQERLLVFAEVKDG